VLLCPLYRHPVKILTVTFAKIIQQILSHKGLCKMKYEIYFGRKKIIENYKVQNEIFKNGHRFQKAALETQI